MTNVPTQLSDEARDALATARAHREAGELDEADAALAEAETHAPRSPEVAVELGLLRTAQVRYKNAVAAFDAALAAGADGDVVDLKREALQLLAIELFQAEDYLGAETAWDEVLAIAPEAMIAAYGKLMAIVADDRIADAVEFAGEVELRWPADAPLNLTSGEVLVTAGRPADALPFFDRALAADPTLEQAATRKLDLLRQLDRADEAAAFAAGLQPELDESVPVLLSRGWVEVARSLLADAVALFD